VADVARVAETPPDGIARDTLLVADLALDSLALTEMITMLVSDYGMRTLVQTLEDRDWSDASVGKLYDEYRAVADAP
jgi:acyl carrier protein